MEEKKRSTALLVGIAVVGVVGGAVALAYYLNKKGLLEDLKQKIGGLDHEERHPETGFHPLGRIKKSK